MNRKNGFDRWGYDKDLGDAVATDTSSKKIYTFDLNCEYKKFLEYKTASSLSITTLIGQILIMVGKWNKLLFKNDISYFINVYETILINRQLAV